MMPRDTNGQGHIFGGVLLSNIDIAGAIAARQACTSSLIRKMVTRAMDPVDFTEPVLVNDILTCYGKVTRVGNTSVGVHVDVEVDRTGVIIPVANADLVFVSVDDNDNPVPISCAPKARKKRTTPPPPAPVVQTPIGERVLAIRKTMLPFETNGMGNIFGGVLLSHMDLAGSYVARRACAGSYIDRCVTRFMDRVEFKKPVKVNDVISCYGSVISIGNTSIKVRVEVEADRGGVIIPVTSADMVFVAVDEAGKPRSVTCSVKGTKSGA
jgi:acyl-CoA thioesterase YciA